MVMTYYHCVVRSQCKIKYKFKDYLLSNYELGSYDGKAGIGGYVF